MLKHFLTGVVAFLFLTCVVDSVGAKTETIQAFWNDDKSAGIAVDFNSENGAVTAIRADGETITVEGESFMPFDVNQGEKETRNEKWVAWNNTEFLGLELLDAQTAVTRWKTGGWTVELLWILDSQRKMLGRKTRALGRRRRSENPCTLVAVSDAEG